MKKLWAGPSVVEYVEKTYIKHKIKLNTKLFLPKAANHTNKAAALSMSQNIVDFWDVLYVKLF